MICGLYLMIVLLAGPFIRQIDDRMCLVVQTHLFLILLMGFVLGNITYSVGSTEDVLASIIMLIVLFALLTLLLYHGMIFLRKWYRNRQRARAVHKEVHMTDMADMVGSPGDGAETTTTTGRLDLHSHVDSSVVKVPAVNMLRASVFHLRNASDLHTSSIPLHQRNPSDLLHTVPLHERNPSNPSHPHHSRTNTAELTRSNAIELSVTSASAAPTSALLVEPSQTSSPTAAAPVLPPISPSTFVPRSPSMTQPPPPPIAEDDDDPVPPSP